MINIGIFVSLLILFYFLGKAADLIVLNIKSIGERLGIRIFFLGLILGFLTTLPELTIGINASTNGLPEIYLGNLLGGIIVIFGLILGLSLILNRKIKTDGKISSFLPILIFIALPFFLGLDNSLSSTDGLFILFGYILLIIRFYFQNKNSEKADKIIISKKEFSKKLGITLIGLILLLVIANLIIRLSLILFVNLNVPIFVVSVLFFAIGTNLPEIIVTIEAWRKNVRELSMSNLIGSAITNPLIIGIFSAINPLYFKPDYSYYHLMALTMFLLAVLLWFYESGKKLTRKEGVILILIYLVFLVGQIAFIL